MSLPDPGPTRRMVRRATRENLPTLVSFVVEACREAQADSSTEFAVRLAVEEVCTNIIDYGYSGTEGGPIDLTFTADPRTVVVTIGDRAKAFSPGDAPAPDVDAPWDERQTGGLGLHLVRNLVDELRYESEPGRGNLLTLVKQRSASQEDHHAG